MLLDTKLGELLLKFSVIDESIFWLRAFDDADFQQWVLDRIRIDQLYEQGIDSEGNIIGYYSAFTEMLNPEKRQGTPYTLKDTGAFYQSMVLYIYENYIEVDADPIKLDRMTGDETNLFTKYGEDIVGLTEESLEKVRQQIKERYLEEITKSLL